MSHVNAVFITMLNNTILIKLLFFKKIFTDVVIENMMNWRHSGFGVYCGRAIWPRNEAGLENLARYIIRASF